MLLLKVINTAFACATIRQSPAAPYSLLFVVSSRPQHVMFSWQVGVVLGRLNIFDRFIFNQYTYWLQLGSLGGYAIIQQYSLQKYIQKQTSAQPHGVWFLWVRVQIQKTFNAKISNEYTPNAYTNHYLQCGVTVYRFGRSKFTVIFSGAHCVVGLPTLIVFIRDIIRCCEGSALLALPIVFVVTQLKCCQPPISCKQLFVAVWLFCWLRYGATVRCEDSSLGGVAKNLKKILTPLRRSQSLLSLFCIIRWLLIFGAVHQYNNDWV
eukprot:TRINITY_DN1261_c0_g1_i3.p2 TRINITY_DN1261_c0_g1~~TRINITY_DN1261_c0_g1_i3.p2  ORF type:complete len:265 (-),score=-53.85 TRINITY_DN1261_c0_g1_i3:94-888(-)